MKNIKNDIDQLTDYIEQLVYHMKVLEQSGLSTLNADVSLQEVQIIVFLGKRGSSKMNEIADHLGISFSNLTFIIDKMVEKNLVERYRSDADRRVVYVKLTGNGGKIFSSHREQKMNLSRDIINTLSEKDRKVFIELMKKISSAIGNSKR